MIIRPATIADRDAVLRLAQEFAATTRLPNTPYGDLLDVDAALLPAIVDETLAEGVVLVAEAEYGDAPSSLVGFLSLEPRVHTFSGERYGEGIALWVDPVYRSGLLAGWLLKHAEAWALAHGCTFLKLGAPVGTEVGGYFTRAGYAPIETAFVKRVA